MAAEENKSASNSSKKLAKNPLEKNLLQVPVVFGYTNYRSFLRDFYEAKKKAPRGFSYRSFSKSAGFSSPNIMKLIIEGQRNLGEESIEKVGKALNLSQPATEYFRELVLMNQAHSDEVKEAHFHKLKKLMPHGKKRELGSEGLFYLSHWLHAAIREMAELPDFRDDPYWISRRLTFPASIKEISEALQFLFDEKFIVKTATGTKPGDQMVISSDEVKSLAIRNFHRQMLHLAKESLEILPVDLREFGALTVHIPESSIGELKQKLKSFRKEIHEWSMQIDKGKDQTLDEESVTQLCFQMFPLSRRIAK